MFLPASMARRCEGRVPPGEPFPPAEFLQFLLCLASLLGHSHQPRVERQQSIEEIRSDHASRPHSYTNMISNLTLSNEYITVLLRIVTSKAKSLGRCTMQPMSWKNFPWALLRGHFWIAAGPSPRFKITYCKSPPLCSFRSGHYLTMELPSEDRPSVFLRLRT